MSKSYDFKGKRIKGTKTGRAREVPVHATLAKVLGAWLLAGWDRLMGRAPKPGDLLFPSAKPELVHGLYRNPNEQRKLVHKLCDELEIRRRRIHDSRRTFISLARDDGAQRDVIKSLTHPLDASDAHDSYTTFAWSRCCEEVAKLRTTLRQPAEVTRLPSEPSRARRRRRQARRRHLRPSGGRRSFQHWRMASGRPTSDGEPKSLVQRLVQSLRPQTKKAPSPRTWG